MTLFKDVCLLNYTVKRLSVFQIYFDFQLPDFQWLRFYCIYIFNYSFADIDECTEVPCENNGTCVNTPGSFYCNCTTVDYDGEFCDGERKYMFYSAIGSLSSHAPTGSFLH